MSARLLGLTISVLALWGCSERVAGGTTGVETTNGIRVLRPDGAPAPGSSVRLRPARWLSGDALPFDTATLSGITGSDGRMVSRTPLSGIWRAEALATNLAAQALDSGAEETILQLTAYARLTGHSAPRDTVRLAGLDRRTVADSTGRFRFDSLPSGVLDAVDENGRHSWIDLEPGDSASAGILRTDSTGSLLLDDFEDGDLRHRWAPRVGGGWWYATHDTTVTSTGNAVESLGGDSGKAYAASYVFDTSRSYAWANFGVSLGNPDTIHLEGLSAVSFRARGIGRVGVSLAAPTGRMEAWIDLSSTWQTVRIPLDSFKIASGSSASSTRGSILASVGSLSWQLLASGEIHLDDIRLEGVTAQSAWRISSEP
jgi:Carbohydrate binding domain (family 11)